MNSSARQSWNINAGVLLRDLVSLLGLICVAGMPSNLGAQTGGGFKPPQEIDGSRTDPNAPPNASTQIGQGPSGDANISSRQAFNQLVKELDNLIPGDLKEGSARKKAVEDAVAQFQLRNANRVVEILNTQAKSDPDFPPTDLLLAGLSFAIQDVRSGRALLERAGLQHPDKPGVYAAFSRLAVNENRIIDAIALLEKMKRVLEESALSEDAKRFYELRYLDSMTDVAMRQQRYPQARELLVKQRSLIPRNPKVLMVSAELEFKENNLEKSMEYLKQLQSSLPQTRAPESIIASWFQRTGQPDQAKKWVSSAAAKYPDNPQVQLEVASWAINEENFPKASASIKIAEVNGETPASKSLKAKIAFAGESYGLAELHYGDLYQQQPKNFDSANMYALSLIESKDSAKRELALEIANKNLAALPDNVVAQAALGYIQLRLGNLEQAKSTIGRATQSNTSSPEIRFFAATLLREMNELDSAKEILTQTINHQGIFLYRAAAKRMLAELSDSLPPPNSNK